MTVDPHIQQQVTWLEQRARMLTGSVLAVLALLACYGLLIFENQLTRPAFHFYPWLAAVLFYLAGDLLAYIWFKVVTIKLEYLLAKLKAEQEEAAQRAARQEYVEEPAAAADLLDAGVEVVRPDDQND